MIGPQEPDAAESHEDVGILFHDPRGVVSKLAEKLLGQRPREAAVAQEVRQFDRHFFQASQGREVGRRFDRFALWQPDGVGNAAWIGANNCEGISTKRCPNSNGAFASDTWATL